MFCLSGKGGVWVGASLGWLVAAVGMNWREVLNKCACTDPLLQGHPFQHATSSVDYRLLRYRSGKAL